METQKRYFFQAVASRSVDKPAQSRGRQERKSQLPTPSHKQQEHVQKKHVLYPLQQLKADKQPTHSIYPIDPINVCPSVPNSPSSARTTHSSPTVETPKVRKPLEPSLPFSPFFPQNIYRSIHPSICCCLPACPATRIPERRTIQPPANTLGTYLTLHTLLNRGPRDQRMGGRGQRNRLPVTATVGARQAKAPTRRPPTFVPSVPIWPGEGGQALVCCSEGGGGAVARIPRHCTAPQHTVQYPWFMGLVDTNISPSTQRA
ncbi:hypothetical protein IWX50DRAFT_614846 [Phyllosticta citricarpa]